MKKNYLLVMVASKDEKIISKLLYKSNMKKDVIAYKNGYEKSHLEYLKDFDIRLLILKDN